jgi:hypothetical protein
MTSTYTIPADGIGPSQVQLRIARATEIAQFCRLYVEAERSIAGAARYVAGTLPCTPERLSQYLEQRDRALATLADLGVELGR